MNVQTSSTDQNQQVAPFASGANSKLGLMYRGLLASLGFVAFLFASAPVQAAAPVVGAAESFAILGGSAVNANGSGSVINGNVGVAPGTSVTGFPANATVTPPFTQLGNTQPAIDARAATLTLYNSADLAPSGATDTGGDDLSISGPTNNGVYPPGKYTNVSGGVALIPVSGSITLDGAGIYIFTVANALTIQGNVNYTNGADACSVFWRVPTLATINGAVGGTIVAGTGVHMGSGASLTGRALAQAAGDVTLAGGNFVGGCSSALLGLQKTVSSGAAAPTDFTLTATGNAATGLTVISGTTPVPAGNAPLGVYTLTETGPVGYTAGAYICDGGSLVGNQLTISQADAGTTITCTIDNAYNPGGSAQLGLLKTVDNGGFGTATAGQFILTATGDQSTGPTVITGTTPVTPANVPVGVYTLTETGPAGYSAAYSCIGGGTLVGNQLTITGSDAGNTITCTIRNTYIPPAAAPIPALSEWAMIMLAALLSIAGYAAMRRQAR